MNKSIYINNQQKLADLMEKAGIEGYSHLSKLSGVSQRELRRLEYGLLPKINLDNAIKISLSLNISLAEFINYFWPETNNINLKPVNIEIQKINSLKQEYNLLQNLYKNQEQYWQESALKIIESWLLKWPTALAAIAYNPRILATQLVPLIKPVERLLTAWEIEATAKVGAKVVYNPEEHQIIGGNVQPGDLVRVRYVGYRQGDKLLYKAKVSAISKS